MFRAVQMAKTAAIFQFLAVAPHETQENIKTLYVRDTFFSVLPVDALLGCA
ncbi:MAG: hypothetical protein ABJK75_03785 [Tateyamaria sp.]|uniref:hypothetical protein n=1 Tax=Tateyamaria sp. TaxID=1929288 RepID=UPI00329F1ABD